MEKQKPHNLNRNKDDNAILVQYKECYSENRMNFHRNLIHESNQNVGSCRWIRR